MTSLVSMQAFRLVKYFEKQQRRRRFPSRLINVMGSDFITLMQFCSE